MRTKCEVWSRPKDSKGRFTAFNGNQRYKQCQVEGVRKQRHVVIWEKYHNKNVTDGQIVHHINEKKLDNRIENLECMHITKHNQKHHNNRVPWNKGKECKNISQSLMGHSYSEKSKRRQAMSWFNKNLDTNIKIWKMKDRGYSVNGICSELNLTKDQVSHRWMTFKKVYSPLSGGELNGR